MTEKKPMKRMVAALLMMAAAMGSGAASSRGEAPAEEGYEVLAGCVEALGGQEAFRAVQALRKTGTYVYNGLEHPVTVVQKRGVGYREEIVGLTQWGTEVDSATVVVRGWDGETAWVGDGVMPKGEVPGFLLDAEIEPSLVGAVDKGHRILEVGETSVDGADAVLVSLARADGTRERWYLAPDSLLPFMRTTDAPESAYQAAMTWYFDDYRDVAGVRMPFYVMIEERLFSREYLFDEIEANGETADGAFSPPPELAGE